MILLVIATSLPEPGIGASDWNECTNQSTLKNTVSSLSCDISNLAPFHSPGKQNHYRENQPHVQHHVVLICTRPYQAHSAHPKRNLFNFLCRHVSPDLAKTLSAAGAHTYEYNDTQIVNFGGWYFCLHNTYKSFVSSFEKNLIKLFNKNLTSERHSANCSCITLYFSYAFRVTNAHFVREFNNTTRSTRIYIKLILEFTFRKNTPTDIHIGMTNSAVMRLGNRR